MKIDKIYITGFFLSLFLFVASAERNENPFADLNQIGKGRRYKVVK